ncbi:MAG: hypothetical protein H7645_10835 [Candidatus Heimdallarchaeota archaeon]|nr:hypothetical protein [Candidatus Heimdallarchaeota archaeon]MCK4770820.1 hypothetical protein [Candidatus Heimdallarchaeota archaeon]
MKQEKLSFLKKTRRLLVKYFLSRNQCHGECSDCDACPWIDKEKYSFEIKRKVES